MATWRADSLSRAGLSEMSVVAVVGPVACCMLHVARASAVRSRAVAERGASQCGLLVCRPRPAYGCRPSNTYGEDLLITGLWELFTQLGGTGVWTAVAELPLSQTCTALGGRACWLHARRASPIARLRGAGTACFARSHTLVATYLWRARGFPAPRRTTSGSRP